MSKMVDFHVDGWHYIWVVTCLEAWAREAAVLKPYEVVAD